MRSLLRNSRSTKVLNLEVVTPEGFMEYVMSRQHLSNGGYLSKLAYGNIRAALFHLFRLHNRLGFPEAFNQELGNLYRGFFRHLTQQSLPQEAEAAVANNGGVDGGGGGGGGGGGVNGVVRGRSGGGVKEGKDPMSVELYRSLSHWFIEWNTMDGIFALCFLVLTWNLSCRANNTCNIKLSEIEWASTFDAFKIYFSPTKTDQTGDEAKYSRHLYANPHSPLVCPVFALSVYFSCCCNLFEGNNNMLFPGPDQYQRFSCMLSHVINEHSEDVHALGFNPSEIGTHSIRKGAISYLSSLPGGPPIASVCILAGWTMGNVKDINLRYVSSGDQFVGRCLSLLPLLQAEFGSSQAYFPPAWMPWVEQYRSVQFPVVATVEHLQQLTTMCLASLVHHHQFILSLPSNHVIRQGALFRNADALQSLDNDEGCIVVSYPWTDSMRCYTGVPPHVALLQEVTYVKEEQRQLIDNFVNKVKTAIDESGVAGGNLTVPQLRAMFDTFAADIRGQLASLEGGVANNAVVDEQNRVETGTGYQLHFFRGRYHRVPEDWRFPRISTLEAWHQWWVGDTIQQITPSRFLEPQDVKFLDDIPLSAQEMHGRSGRFQNSRRNSRKTLNDLSFLMKYITRRVEEANAMEQEITITSVTQMFQVVEDDFIGPRNAQKRWNTASRELRHRMRLERLANDAIDAMEVEAD